MVKKTAPSWKTTTQRYITMDDTKKKSINPIITKKKIQKNKKKVIKLCDIISWPCLY